MKKLMSAIFLAAAVGVACSAHKPLKSTIDSDSFVAKADLQDKTFHLVRNIEEADSENDVGAIPGEGQDFGIVKVEITEKELRLLSAFDPSGRSVTAKVLASYPIKKHFDIIRDKNDFNEDTNHVVEDTSNPWNQRAYVRVDWSKPSNSFSSIETQLSEGENAPKISEVNTVLKEDLTNDKGHFSFLTEVGIEGKNMVRTLPPFGVDPVSAFRVTYRTHLVPLIDTDYKANAYSLKDFGRFGFFTTQQDFRNPERGYQDSELKIYANTFNVCEAGAKGSCATNTVKFVLTKDFPDDYKAEARAAVALWNTAFQQALGRADNVVLLDETQQGTLSSPLQNVIAVYPERSQPGLLGISNKVIDPRTGEIVSTRAVVYQDSINAELGYVDSIIDLLASSDPLKNVLGLKIPDDQKVVTLPPYRADLSRSALELSRRVLGLNTISNAASANLSGVLSDETARSGAGNPGARLSGQSGARRLGGTTRAEARLKAVMDNAPQYFHIPEMDFTGDLDVVESDVSAANAKQYANLKGMEKLLLLEDVLKTEQRSRLLQTQRGIHGAEFVEDAVMHYLLRQAGGSGIAALLKNREAIKKSIAKQIFLSTILHEMGHSFGLRHNFAASSDMKHYSDRWQILKNRIKAGDKTLSDADLAPYQYSSVMDYGADFFSTQAGLGSYDKAAIKYAYNRSIDRENDPVVKEGFLFCTDHQLNQTINCRQFDRGATATEITQNEIDRYNADWALTHFRRGRADYNRIGKAVAHSETEQRFIPIRQVMDEYMYMKAASNSIAIAGKCPNDFLQASVDKGELRNICDPTEARNANVNSSDDASLMRALYDASGNLIKKDPSDLAPMGAADLLRANLLAQQFFQDIFGSTEPGYFVIQPPVDANSVATITGLGPVRPNASDLQADLVNLAKIQNITDPVAVNQFVEQNKNNIIYVPVGRYAKAYSSVHEQVGTFQELKQVGSAVDKIAAMMALACNNLANPRYDLLSIAGSPYSFDQSRTFMTKIFGKLILGQGKITPIVVQGLDGKLILAQVEAAIDPTLSRIAATLAMTKLVTDFDPSILGKTRICAKGEAGCANRLGLETVEATNSGGTDTYVAVQTLSHDSIAFDLISSLKKEADERDLLVKQLADPQAAKAANIAKLDGLTSQGATVSLELQSLPDVSSAVVQASNAQPSTAGSLASSLVMAMTEAIKNDDVLNADELKAQLVGPLKSLSSGLDAVNLAVTAMGAVGQCAAGDVACTQTPSSARRRQLVKLQTDLLKVVKTASAACDSEVKLKAAPSDMRLKSEDLAGQEATVELLRNLNQALKDK